MTEKIDLTKHQCVPCQCGAEALKGEAIDELLKELSCGWQVVDEHCLEKEYKFKNFREAFDFVNKVGELAEEQRHHPDIYLAWGKVKLTVWTHKIDGLHKNDFMFAAKVDIIQ